MSRAIIGTGSTIQQLTTLFFEQREFGAEILTNGGDVRVTFLRCARRPY